MLRGDAAARVGYCDSHMSALGLGSQADHATRWRVACGSDTTAPLVRGLYWASLASLVFLAIYRVLSPFVVHPRSPSPVVKDRA